MNLQGTCNNKIIEKNENINETLKKIVGIIPKQNLSCILFVQMT